MSPEAEASPAAAAPLSYTLEDGREFTASNRMEAVAQCPFLSKLPVEQAGAFLDLIELSTPRQPEPSQEAPAKRLDTRQAEGDREAAATEKQKTILNRENEIPETELAETQSLLKPLAIENVLEAAADLVQEPSQAKSPVLQAELVPEIHPEQIMQIEQQMVVDMQPTEISPAAEVATPDSVRSEETSAPPVDQEVPKELVKESVIATTLHVSDVISDQLAAVEHGEELVISEQYEKDEIKAPDQDIPHEIMSSEQPLEAGIEMAEDGIDSPDELPLVATSESSHETTFDAHAFTLEITELLDEGTGTTESILPAPNPSEQEPESSFNLFAPYLPQLHERILNNEPLPAELSGAITRLQEAVALDSTTPMELTEELLTDIITVLTGIGCQEPQKILREFAKNHDTQELFLQLSRELPDLTKLVDYQQHLLQALSKILAASDRRTTISRMLWELLYKSVFARPVHLLY